MSGQTTNVVVAGYLDPEAARRDFEAVIALVRDKHIATEGVILVTKSASGDVSVVDTGDRLGRRGAAWGAGVGAVVGLFAPPLLVGVAAGGAGGAAAGRFAEHKLARQIHDRIGGALPPGRAGIIGVFPEEDRLRVEQALSGSPAKSVVPMDSKGLKGLQEAIEEAMRTFSPDRTALPIADRRFGGTVGRTLEESVADWTIVPGPTAPAGAPNVLVVLIDDAGFGQPDTFGGPISTPTLTRLQAMGITYNRFHVTALCSPTRAALLTGRNPHRVGFGSIAEYPGPFPGYSAVRPRTCTAIPRILKENGYVTAGFGKWHLTPDSEQGAAGPFDRWPQGWGFDHWWGFLSGAAGQYDPIVTQDSSTLGVPGGKDGKQYYFPDDITDKAVEWLHAVRAQDREKPWMVYYSTGCAHAPHHVAKEWADRYKGQFDQGWDRLREEVLARQKRLGIVPEDTVLTERPEAFPAWDSLTNTQKRLYARQMEVFAGYSENADWNVGRLVEALEEMGELDNTLIFYIWGDNGASMEGTTTGSFNEMTFLNGLVLDADEQLRLIEDYGGIEALGNDHTAPHYAAAWAHAGNTPFRWGKQLSSHLGGTRNPMVVAWPHRLPPSGGLRSQFTHCIDIAPTILEAVGLPEPKRVDGIDQEPMDGTSFAYTFGDALAPERHTTQYFEMFGSRAMYKDGWWACTKLDRIPWDFSPQTLRRFGPGSGWDPDREGWELYYLPDDFSQAKDVAGLHPEKLRELQQLWWEEAARNRVLPLLGGLSVVYGLLPPMPTATRMVFAGDVQNVQRGMVPRILGRSYAIEADLYVPEGGAEGVIVANADFIGGFALWIDDRGRLTHTYSLLGIETYRQVASEPVPPGEATVRMLFAADRPEPGTGGRVTLFVNDRPVGDGTMPRTVPLAFSSYSGMDIGRDNGLVVDRAYESRAPYPFTGLVKNVVFDLKPAATVDLATHEDEKSLHEVAHQQLLAEGAAG